MSDAAKKNFNDLTCKEFRTELNDAVKNYNSNWWWILDYNDSDKGAARYRFFTVLFYATNSEEVVNIINDLESHKAVLKFFGNTRTDDGDDVKEADVLGEIATTALFGPSTNSGKSKSELEKIYIDCFRSAAPEFLETDTLSDRVTKFIDSLKNIDVKLKENAENKINKNIEKIFNSEKPSNSSKDPNKEKENMSRKIQRIKELLESRDVKQIIFTGAPGTGKTYQAKKIAEEIVGKENVDDQIKLVQFHPSYDYTDFVEGLRPVEDAGAIQFRKLDGIFKRFCRKAAKAAKAENENRKKKFFFIIDEINRADLSKVFGELMFCLESDKRDTPVDTQYHNLPTYGEKAEEDVFNEGFYIPSNIYIIGTMNDIDRSVESMDFALRRRFIWEEFEVDEDMLTEAFNTGDCFDEILEENAVNVAEWIMNMNEKGIKEVGKSFSLNEHYYISQGQFANIKVDKEQKNDKQLIILIQKIKKGLALKAGDKEVDNFVSKYPKLAELLILVWDKRINPLLKEYVRGEDPESVEKFIKTCKINYFNVNGQSN